MESQTFRAATMLQALQVVQKELGSEAIVVSMREQPASVWRKACCEIVATRPTLKAIKAAPVDPAKVPIPTAHKAYSVHNLSVVRKVAAEVVTAPVSSGKTAVPFMPRMLSSLSGTTGAGNRAAGANWDAPVIDAQKELEPIETRLSVPAKVERLEPGDNEGHTVGLLPLDKLRQRLLKQGLNEGLVDRLVRTCVNTLSAFRLEDEAYLTEYVKKQLLAALKPSSQNLAQGRQVVCLVGMGGAGKTSMAAKLAAHFSLQLGKRVVWIEANTVRTGAITEARMITESFGVELHLAYSPADLIEAMEKTRDADLVLVDTAGCNPRREADLVDLGALVTNLVGRTTYLVAPATTKEADLMQALAAFGPFYLDGLVVTKMDETTTFGSIYNLAWQSKLPIVFFTEGSGAIDGLKGGSSQFLVDALFAEGA